MNLLPTHEQSEIISVVRQFLVNELSVRRYQEPCNRAGEYSPELWQQLVGLGWFGIGVSDAAGGMGLGLAEEIMLAREGGRQLVSPTVLGTSYAVHLLAEQGRFQICNELIAGNARAALALPESVGVDKGRVSATLSIFDGSGAQYIVACGRECCFVLEATALVAPASEPCTDESLRLERARAEGALALASSTDMRLRNVFALMLAAAQTGIAEAARDDAVAYARERVQFGQPIGSFQAISHMCADMAVLCEAAWAQCVYAALACAEETPGVSQATASAAVLGERASLDNARANIQIHGGVGFTVEYDAHYFMKRSHVYRQLGRAALSALDELIPRESGRASQCARN